MTSLRKYAVTKQATVLGINAKTVATTALFTVPDGFKLIVDHIVIRVATFTVGSKAVQAVASFGANSATFDDYLDFCHLHRGCRGTRPDHQLGGHPLFQSMRLAPSSR